MCARRWSRRSSDLVHGEARARHRRHPRHREGHGGDAARGRRRGRRGGEARARRPRGPGERGQARGRRARAARLPRRQPRHLDRGGGPAGADEPRRSGARPSRRTWTRTSTSCAPSRRGCARAARSSWSPPRRRSGARRSTATTPRARAAIVSLTKGLAVELAPDVRVNCVAPGWTDTEMAAEPYAGGGRKADRGDDSLEACGHARGRRGADRLPLLRSRASRHRRDPERERRERAVWLRSSR